MMTYAELTRSELAAVLGEIQVKLSNFRSGTPKYTPASRSLIACWREDITAGIPNLLIIPDDEVAEFFAWSVTFLNGYRPLTSFIRVLSWTDFLGMAKKQDRSDPELHGSLLLGAVLGEALAESSFQGGLNSLPLTAFESTYSFAMGKGVLNRHGNDFLERLPGSWNLARSITDQRDRRLTIDQLQTVWSVLLAVLRTERVKSSEPSDMRLNLLVNACRDVREMGAISSVTWTSLSDDRVPNPFYSDTKKSSKEYRVETFERVLRDLLRTHRPGDIRVDFLAGYMTSVISDGSLEHALLLAPLLEVLPTAIVWYGIFSGLIARNRLLGDYNHLGLRLMRSMSKSEDLLSEPACDISLQELEIITRGEPKSRLFRQTHASVLKVELLPLISTLIKWSTSGGEGNQLSLFPSDERQSKAQFNRIRELLSTLRISLQLAEELQGESEPSKWNVTRNKKRN